jgi:ATP-dependent Clp protease ATP-binding subunit ClpX
MAQAMPEDLERYGMIPELIGRLPVIASLDHLSEEDLARILVEPKDALTKQYRVLFRHDGARLEFEAGAIREVARRAMVRGTGARALRSVMESLMLDIMFELPERAPGRTYTINERVVRGEESLFGPESG